MVCTMARAASATLSMEELNDLQFNGLLARQEDMQVLIKLFCAAQHGWKSRVLMPMEDWELTDRFAAVSGYG